MRSFVVTASVLAESSCCCSGGDWMVLVLEASNGRWRD
jgi:hypothetical protein